MKKYYTICILVLAASLVNGCSGGLTVSEPTLTPTPIPPTETPEPTATLLPTEIPVLERWEMLLPEDIQICKQVNRFSPWDLQNIEVLQQELGELLLLERNALEVDSVVPLVNYDLKNLFRTMGFSESLLLGQSPSIIAIEQHHPVITSCSYLPFSDEEGVYVIGIAARRRNAYQLSILHYAVDYAGILEIFSSLGFPGDVFDLEKQYDSLVSGRFTDVLIAVTSGRGNAKAEGEWAKSLQLLYNQGKKDGKELSYFIKRFFDTTQIKYGSSNFKSEILNLQDNLEKYIIPIFALSFH